MFYTHHVVFVQMFTSLYGTPCLFKTRANVDKDKWYVTTVLVYVCFLQARCPSCRPTNSVNALKAKSIANLSHINKQ